MDTQALARLSLFARGNSKGGRTEDAIMISLRIAATGLALTALLAGAAYAQPSSGSPSVDWASAQTVEIDLDSFSIAPQSLHLKQGTPYRLHFVNKSSKGHNYDAPQFFAALAIAPDDQAKVVKGKLELGEGESADVKAVPDKAGKYAVQCSHFLHASFGMTGEAVIE
jgi:plastocyanin